MASMRFFRLIKAAATVALAASAALPAQAAVSTWNFNGGGCTDPNLASPAIANVYTCAGAIPTLTATAWAASGTGAGATFASAYLSPNSGATNNAGFGVKNQQEITAAGGVIANVGANDHALDNNGQTDAMLLSFAANSPVALSSITLGFVAGDSDISLLRYTGTSAPTIAGKSITTLLGSLAAGGGWELVGNYANLTTSTAGNTLATGNKSSSWWLISAYNASYGSTGSGNGAASGSVNFDATSDYIKVLAVAGTPTGPGNAGGIPEPGSLALVGAALTGILVARQRKPAAR